uniref:Chondroitin proteoglycan 4 domain-containing protein n=1 Tax=Caenorhabditis japonica TaxID=281687 RepID=A0A8R1DGZ1_CAEJA
MKIPEISGQFECIQDSVGDLQQECEKMCSVQADVLENAAKNSADQLLSMEKMCNATTCLAFCYETSLPKYCDIGEDNLFDTIFSQLESLQEQPGIFGYLKKDEPKKTGVAKLLGLMMPEGCDAEKLKIKLPKKVAVPDTATPKSVGPAKKAAASDKLAEVQKNATTVVPELAPEILLKAKAGNLSSAAIMINGKVQTLQCQVLDSHGNSQNAPDFESLAEILATHFNKKTMEKVPTDRAEKKEEDTSKRSCRDVATRQQESENTNSGSTIAVSALVWLIAICI